jgi:hypothetical protein
MLSFTHEVTRIPRTQGSAPKHQHLLSPSLLPNPYQNGTVRKPTYHSKVPFSVRAMVRGFYLVRPGRHTQQPGGHQGSPTFPVSAAYQNHSPTPPLTAHDTPLESACKEGRCATFPENSRFDNVHPRILACSWVAKLRICECDSTIAPGRDVSLRGKTVLSIVRKSSLFRISWPLSFPQDMDEPVM